MYLDTELKMNIIKTNRYGTLVQSGGIYKLIRTGGDGCVGYKRKTFDKAMELFDKLEEIYFEVPKSFYVKYERNAKDASVNKKKRRERYY